MDRHHKDILTAIRANANKATQHTHQDNYLGSSHPRYDISNPVLRMLAKEWMKSHRDLSADDLANVVTSLIEGKSATEKWMGGMLLDYAKPEQLAFEPALFDEWLEHIMGWAEVDVLCSGSYSVAEVPRYWKKWEPLLRKFSKSKNIHKRRASLVLLIAPLRKKSNEPLAAMAIENIERLKGEKEILITKAISWILRTMIKHHKDLVAEYIEENRGTLPSIAVRETLVKLTTGRKTKPRD
ncbi:DNA alkylation repair protein [Ohtaekwangia kribbensis]|jgi:3-methyladenine DNA glycosylase AlkD|uniref:DNA alkylation repair protein n=1 Tax=Ohtaekwangia kribbensis TaxID=688913 RepID=A0ABW3JZP7_9BACT